MAYLPHRSVTRRNNTTFPTVQRQNDALNSNICTYGAVTRLLLLAYDPPTSHEVYHTTAQIARAGTSGTLADVSYETDFRMDRVATDFRFLSYVGRRSRKLYVNTRLMLKIQSIIL